MRWSWLLVLALPLGAQQRGMYGGISTGQMVGVTNDPGFASRLGATVSGLPQTTTRIPSGNGIYGGGGGYRQPGYGGYGGGHAGRGGGRTLVVPYGIPMAMPYPVPVEYEPAPAMVQPIQQSPSVIINQYYSPESVHPQMKEYDDLPQAALPRTEVHSGEARIYPPAARQPKAAAPVTPQPAAPRNEEGAAETSSKATITLLAFADSTVVTAIAYWQQGDSLHYVTNGFSKRVVPIHSLDKALTEQLNRERKVDFQLEAMR